MKQLDFEIAIKAHLKQAGLSQAMAARKLGYSPDQFNKWVRGVNRIPDVAIQELSDLLDLSEEERIELFTLAGYVAIRGPQKEADRVDKASVDESNTVTKYDQRLVPIRFDSTFFIEALKSWGNNFFHWQKASDHMRSSWAGMVIYSLSAVVGRMTLQGLLTIIVSLLLAIMTIQLVASVFQWPLNDIDTRRNVYLRFGLATLLIPLLVASVTPPEKDDFLRSNKATDELTNETAHKTNLNKTFWVLKFVGATVGFWVFSLIVIGLALVWYYLPVPPLTAEVRAGFALVPLFFSYVAARRVPVDRHKMFDGELKLHPADPLFLIFYLGAGPLFALFLYSFHGFLLDKTIAPLTLLMALIVVAGWEYRKQDHHKFPDSIFILMVGLLMPVIILLYAFFLVGDIPTLSVANVAYITIISIYFLSWTLIATTVLVRQPPVLTLPGIFSFLGLLIIANLMAITNRWLAISFIAFISLGWAIWGRKRFRAYFWVHSSIWIMIVISAASLYLLIFEILPIWINGLGFLATWMILINWAYHRSEDRSIMSLDESKEQATE